MPIIDVEEHETDDLLALMEYIEHFDIHYSLLIRRYARFKQINNIHNTDIDVITYLDMIVVQLRALCIESSRQKNNYTAQILLRKVGEEELADKIESMLDEEFIVGVKDFNIRKALKVLADGFICHYDNFDGVDKDGWAMANIIESKLRNPYDNCNLDHIMKVLIDCIGEGLSIKLK